MRTTWIATLMAAMLGSCAAVLAEDKPIHSELKATQEFTRSQFQDLIKRMADLGVLLEKSDPATAKVLAEAVAAAQKALVAEDMQRVAELLAKGLTSSAAGKQPGLIKEMMNVLRILQEGSREAKVDVPALRAALAEVNGAIKTHGELMGETAGLAARDANAPAGGSKPSGDDKGRGKSGDANSPAPPPDKYELAQLDRRRKQDANALAGEQEKLGEKVRDLAERVGKAGAPNAGETVGKAGRSMGGAAGEISEGRPGQAAGPQRDAMEKLKQGREEIARVIEREEGRERLEKLAEVDRMLQEILDAQKQLSAETKKVAALGGQREPRYARGEQLRLAELSRGEGAAAEKTGKVVDLLGAGRSGAKVFPMVLRQVRHDLEDAQDLLARSEAGDYTQGVQREIERLLQELIDSVREQLAEYRKKDRGQSPGSDGKPTDGPPPDGPPELVSKIAELKMLRLMQVEVNRRTADLSARAARGEMPETQSEVEHRRLARQQDVIRDMLGEIKGVGTGRARPD